jgi:DNA-binding transcriptional ArsR family regulator
MKEGPDIARIAALIGDPARANMLAALMDGRALTASELAAEAGVTKQTASSHLAQLAEGGLLACAPQGRHRYFRLAGEDVGEAIEALMGLAQARGGQRTRTGPKDLALRRARICYGHLAGEMGVALYGGLSKRRWLKHGDGKITLTPAGAHVMESFGVDVSELSGLRRPMCRACLDWSERRHHLAGSLGEALLTRMMQRGWARRERGTRVIAFNAKGERALADWLG